MLRVHEQGWLERAWRSLYERLHGGVPLGVFHFPSDMGPRGQWTAPTENGTPNGNGNGEQRERDTEEAIREALELQRLAARLLAWAEAQRRPQRPPLERPRP